MSVFQDHNKIAKHPDDVERIVRENQSKGLTDDGTRPIAVRLEQPIKYYDPGLPVTHGPAIVATNTLQKAYAEERGWKTDPAEVHAIRLAEQAAKDAAPET